MTTYFLKVANADTEELTALAYGNLAEIAAVAKRQIKELSGSSETYLVRLTEVAYIGVPDGEQKRTLTSLSAEGDAVAFLLKRKLAAEKKEQALNDAAFGPADEEPEHREPSDTV